MATLTFAALKHFPFPSYTAFKEAVATGRAMPRVDPLVAMRWINETRAAPGTPVTGQLVLLAVPWVLLPSLFFYVLLTHSSHLLLVLPYSLAAFFVVRPLAQPLSKTAGLVACVLVVVVPGLPRPAAPLTGIVWLIIFASQAWLYRRAVAYFLNLSLQFEELLCLSWELGHLNILLPNGDVHQRFVKIVNGQSQAQPDVSPEQILSHLERWTRGA